MLKEEIKKWSGRELFISGGEGERADDPIIVHKSNGTDLWAVRQEVVEYKLRGRDWLELYTEHEWLQENGRLLERYTYVYEQSGGHVEDTPGQIVIYFDITELQRNT
jgi:hypothetical protein